MRFKPYKTKLHSFFIQEDISLICKICFKKQKSNGSLSQHIKRTHKIEIKDYYDNFLKKSDKDGFCAICGSPTNFTILNKGYNKFCINCVGHYTKENFIKMYGADGEKKFKEYQDKRKNTLENYIVHL